MQGFLIAAYKDEEQLLRLVRSLCNKSKVYVHINKLSQVLDEKKMKALNIPNTYFFKKYKITWGSFTHIKAILFLLMKMVKDTDINYIHIISGQDMRVKSWNELSEKFDNNSQIYMSCSPLEKAPKYVQDRYLYRHCFSKTGLYNNYLGLFNRIICNLQDKFGLKRKKIGEFSSIYKGMIWVSAPSTTFKYATDYIKKHKKFLYDISHSIIPEEILFQTIFMNSPYKNNICKDIRYMDWTKRNGSSPAILDESDIDKIKKSDFFFARKVDSNVSYKLIEAFKDI